MGWAWQEEADKDFTFVLFRIFGCIGFRCYIEHSLVSASRGFSLLQCMGFSGKAQVIAEGASVVTVCGLLGVQAQ